MNIKELVAHWRGQSALCRQKCQFGRADAFTACADQLEQEKPSHLLCPTPEVKGLIPVVIYLANEEDVQEVVEAFKAAKPGCIAKKL